MGFGDEDRILTEKLYILKIIEQKPRPQTHFGVFRTQETCLAAASVVLFRLNEI